MITHRQHVLQELRRDRVRGAGRRSVGHLPRRGGHDHGQRLLVVGPPPRHRVGRVRRRRGLRRSRLGGDPLLEHVRQGRRHLDARTATSGTGTSRRSSTTCGASTAAIQRYAINKAVAGDRVQILPGIYEEQVDIAKNLTLDGAGRARRPSSRPRRSRSTSRRRVRTTTTRSCTFTTRATWTSRILLSTA